MEQPESIEPLATVSDSGKVLVTSQGHTGGSNVLVPPTSPSRPSPSSLAPLPCPTCGVAPSANGGAVATRSYIYAIGRIEPRFPWPSIEKEFIQATGRAETAGLTDRQAFQNVLSQRQNRYLARQLCWVLTIEALETYILVPRDPGDFDLLVEALR